MWTKINKLKVFVIIFITKINKFNLEWPNREERSRKKANQTQELGPYWIEGGDFGALVVNMRIKPEFHPPIRSQRNLNSITFSTISLFLFDKSMNKHFFNSKVKAFVPATRPL